MQSALAQISWPTHITFEQSVAYRSARGQVNRRESHFYYFKLDGSEWGSPSGKNGKGHSANTVDAKAGFRRFKNPKELHFPGVYAYTYPTFMDGHTIFPVKIGMSETSVYARIRRQIVDGGAAIPENPIVICAIPVDNGAPQIEESLHAFFQGRETRGGGIEWFTISLEELQSELLSRGYPIMWNSKLT